MNLGYFGTILAILLVLGFIINLILAFIIIFLKRTDEVQVPMGMAICTFLITNSRFHSLLIPRSNCF